MILLLRLWPRRDWIGAAPQGAGARACVAVQRWGFARCLVLAPVRARNECALSHSQSFGAGASCVSGAVGTLPPEIGELHA